MNLIRMKAAVMYHSGSPEVLQLEERPMPVPAEGQVLVRVKSFGLNRSELMTRKGLSPNVRFPGCWGSSAWVKWKPIPPASIRKGNR